MRAFIFFIALLASLPSFASGNYCRAQISQCKSGDVIQASGENIAKYCDFKFNIAPMTSVNNLGDNKNVTASTVACIYIGRDRSK